MDDIRRPRHRQMRYRRPIPPADQRTAYRMGGEIRRASVPPRVPTPTVSTELTPQLPNAGVQSEKAQSNAQSVQVTPLAKARQTTILPQAQPAPVSATQPMAPAVQLEPDKQLAPTPREKKPRRSRQTVALYSLAGAFVVAGIVIAGYGVLMNHRVETQAQAMTDDSETSSAVSTDANQLPSDKKPGDANYIENYKVAAALPRVITIPSIGVKARVLQVGVDKNNAMLTPATSYDTAWYNGSSRPGEMGAAIINGHVLAQGGSGIFGRVKELQAGSEIVIERGDGTKLTYSVVRVETIATDAVDMGKLLVSADTNKPGLSLITCAGKFNARDVTFSDRTIVYAVQR